MPVKIWLKIFHKRHEITIENKKGLYLNNDFSKKIKVIKICKKKNLLYCNNKECQMIFVQPAEKSLTVFSTELGNKQYNGEFDIILKDGHFFIINKTSFKEYLQGVVGSELGESFHIETLKAQAVLSRSYFLMQKDKFKHLDIDACDIDGHFQVYKGVDRIGPKVVQSVEKTEGEIIINSKGPFVPYFHSTCGGLLLSPQEAWGNDKIKTIPEFRRHDGILQEPNCKHSPYFQWNAKIKKSKIMKALYDRLSISKKIVDLRFHFDKHDILRTVSIITKHNNPIIIKGFEFKAFLEREGITCVRSVRMQVEEKGKYYFFKGNGFGHLVGLCQWGAEYMAKKRANYREILEFYFPGSYVVMKY